MDNRITDELQSFMKDYAADPTPRDFAIAKHFYNLALEDVKKGWPVSTYTFCYAATPQESMNKKHIKEREEKK